jgi:hypothetical protein
MANGERTSCSKSGFRGVENDLNLGNLCRANWKEKIFGNYLILLCQKTAEKTQLEAKVVLWAEKYYHSHLSFVRNSISEERAVQAVQSLLRERGIGQEQRRKSEMHLVAFQHEISTASEEHFPR